MSELKKQVTQEEYLRRRKNLRILLILLAAIIACIAAFLGYSITHPSTGGLNGSYTCQLTEDNSYTFHLNLDASTAQFTTTVEQDSMDKGNYRVKKDVLILNSASGSKSEYDILDDCLLSRKHYYEGTLPDGDTFAATITQVTDTFSLTLEFREDGTYLSTLSSDSDDDGSETTAVTEGVYTRTGDFIDRKRQKEDGEFASAPRLIVKNGRVNSNFFVKDMD